MRGASRFTTGSSMRARRSEASWALARMLRRFVLDFGDRAAKRGEPRLLLQKAGNIALHRGKLALGLADLVLALRCLDDAAGIFGIGRGIVPLARVRRPIGRTSTA